MKKQGTDDYLLTKEYVGTALVGVRSIEHADENCKTFDWKLTEEEMKILDSKIEECAL
mgnify:CR=1 FL=1